MTKVSYREVAFEVIKSFGRDGAISDQVVSAMAPARQNSITPRFAELAKLGKIVYHTTPRRNSAGINQKVMMATEFATSLDVQAQPYIA